MGFENKLVYNLTGEVNSLEGYNRNLLLCFIFCWWLLITTSEL